MALLIQFASIANLQVINIGGGVAFLLMGQGFNVALFYVCTLE